MNNADMLSDGAGESYDACDDPRAFCDLCRCVIGEGEERVVVENGGGTFCVPCDRDCAEGAA